MNRQATSEHKGHGSRQVAKHGAPVRRPMGGKAGPKAQAISPEIRRAMVAEAAYYRAERRGFVPGDDLGDWLQAEAEIESLLNGGAKTQ